MTKKREITTDTDAETIADQAEIAVESDLPEEQLEAPTDQAPEEDTPETTEDDPPVDVEDTDVEEPADVEDTDDAQDPESEEKSEEIDADDTPVDLEDIDDEQPAELEPEPGIEPEDEDFEPTLESVIEAVLFATDEPLTATRLASIVETTNKQVREIIAQLNGKYRVNANAFRIDKIAGGYQMLTLSPYNHWLKKMLRARSDSKLSPAALETLAIVSYKQPIIRADIESIRGVAVGEVIRSLMGKGLVKIVGRAEILGRPMLYGTTKKFLSVFGLNTLKDLPKIEELKRPKDRLEPEDQDEEPTETDESPIEESPVVNEAIELDTDEPIETEAVEETVESDSDEPIEQDIDEETEADEPVDQDDPEDDEPDEQDEPDPDESKDDDPDAGDYIVDELDEPPQRPEPDF